MGRTNTENINECFNNQICDFNESTLLNPNLMGDENSENWIM